MFKLLQTFIAVYETRSFSKAASQLFISQPTVSVHIKQLEEKLTVRLFERNGHTDLYPTNNARRFYQHALHLLDDWQAATASLTIEANPVKTQVVIGASQTTATVLLPKIFEKFPQEIRHRVHFKIEMHNSEEILAGVLNKQFDLGLIEKPITHDFIVRDSIAVDQLVLAGDLSSDTWLVREKGSGVYHYMQQYFKQEYIVPSQFLTISNNDVIVKMLSAGIGKSIVSIQSLPEHVPYQTLSTAFNRDFYLIHHQHQRTDLNDIIMALESIAKSL